MAQYVHISSPPAPGLRLPSLQVLLHVCMVEPAAATCRLLAALPGLRELDISFGESQYLADSQVQGAEGEATLPGPALTPPGTSFTALKADYWGSEFPAAGAAEHFACVFGAAAHLQELNLRWPRSSSAMPHLPDLGSMRQLRCLKFRGGDDEQVQLEDLLLMLRPPAVANSLRSLRLVSMRAINPQAVLVLQEVLPALTHLEMVYCSDLPGPPPLTAAGAQGGVELRTKEQRWALLRQLVLPRLTFEFHPIIEYHH